MASRRGKANRKRKLPKLAPVSEAARRPGRMQVPVADDEPEAPHQASGTAVAAEALRSGLSPLRVPRRREAIPHESDITVGDPDDDTLANEYVGEDVPGASSPTPDQNGVDDIGRAYGLQEEDTGALRSSFEVLQRRDRHRSELRRDRTRRF